MKRQQVNVGSVLREQGIIGNNTGVTPTPSAEDIAAAAEVAAAINAIGGHEVVAVMNEDYENDYENDDDDDYEVQEETPEQENKRLTGLKAGKNGVIPDKISAAIVAQYLIRDVMKEAKLKNIKVNSDIHIDKAIKNIIARYYLLKPKFANEMKTDITTFLDKVSSGKLLIEISKAEVKVTTADAREIKNSYRMLFPNVPFITDKSSINTTTDFTMDTVEKIIKALK